VTRSIGSGYGYSCGYDGQMSDPQGMPLTGNAPWGWGTTGHAANRLTGIAPWSERPLRSHVTHATCHMCHMEYGIWDPAYHKPQALQAQATSHKTQEARSKKQEGQAGNGEGRC
jgi:hypothetical protein